MRTFRGGKEGGVAEEVVIPEKNDDVVMKERDAISPFMSSSWD